MENYSQLSGFSVELFFLLLELVVGFNWGAICSSIYRKTIVIEVTAICRNFMSYANFH